jgi:hypothetical protein
VQFLTVVCIAPNNDVKIEYLFDNHYTYFGSGAKKAIASTSILQGVYSRLERINDGEGRSCYNSRIIVSMPNDYDGYPAFIASAWFFEATRLMYLSSSPSQISADSAY